MAKPAASARRGFLDIAAATAGAAALAITAGCGPGSRTTAAVCWLPEEPLAFAAAFAVRGGQRNLERRVFSPDLSPGGFLLPSRILVFPLGRPLDRTVIIISIPAFLPVPGRSGMDPLFFVQPTALKLRTALPSPPMDMAACCLAGVAPLP